MNAKILTIIFILNVFPGAVWAGQEVDCKFRRSGIKIAVWDSDIMKPQSNFKIKIFDLNDGSDLSSVYDGSTKEILSASELQKLGSLTADLANAVGTEASNVGLVVKYYDWSSEFQTDYKALYLVYSPSKKFLGKAGEPLVTLIEPCD